MYANSAHSDLTFDSLPVAIASLIDDMLVDDKKFRALIDDMLVDDKKFRAALCAFYARHNPDKLAQDGEVDKILTDVFASFSIAS